jgi:hypothetical protein
MPKQAVEPEYRKPELIIPKSVGANVSGDVSRDRQNRPGQEDPAGDENSVNGQVCSVCMYLAIVRLPLPTLSKTRSRSVYSTSTTHLNRSLVALF